VAFQSSWNIVNVRTYIICKEDKQGILLINIYHMQGR